MAGGVEYQVTKVDPTDPQTKGMVHQVHKVSEEIAATIGGKVYRARIINDPTAPTVAGKVYQIVLIDDPDDPSVKGMVYNAILTGGSEAIVVGPAVSPLSLPDAIADSLTYVKAFGGTQQNGTPTPTVPVDIVSNNGALRVGKPSGVPLNYTAVEYLQNGSGNCAINTGITPTNTSRVEMKWSVPDTGSIYIFGSRPGGSTQVFTLSGSQSGGTVTAYANGLYKAANTNGVNWSRTAGIDNIFNSYFAVNNGEAEYAVDDLVNDRHCDEFFAYTPWVGDIDTPLHLFSNGYNSQPGGAKIWYCKIYNGETLLMDLVPVIRNSDNVGGFYDKVGGGFYTTEQGGTYTGTPISDPVTIYADGTVETIEDTIGNTATTEMLLKVGDYTDEQEIISGVVMRNVGVKVFDGTENWQNISGYYNISKTALGTNSTILPAATTDIICTHYKTVSGVPTETSVNVGGSYVNFRDDNISTLADWTSWLAGQYNAGTPVILVYAIPATTESVTGQTLQVQDGDNTLEITQASLTGLELEAQYEAVVTLTVQETEDANLDDNVTVTIG